MTDWWTKIVVGEGNVIRERSLTNWNTFDASKVVEEKKREKAASAAPTFAQAPAGSSEGGKNERE